MSIVGVVVIVDPAVRDVVERLATVKGLEIGPRRGGRIACVLDEVEAHVRERLERMQSIAGVLSVAPVFHASEEP